MSCLVCFFKFVAPSELYCCIYCTESLSIYRTFEFSCSRDAVQSLKYLWDILRHCLSDFLFLNPFYLFSRLDTCTLSKYKGLDPGSLYLFYSIQFPPWLQNKMYWAWCGHWPQLFSKNHITVVIYLYTIVMTWLSCVVNYLSYTNFYLLFNG